MFTFEVVYYKPFMFFSELKKYEKNVDANFYYDFENEQLK